MNKTLKQLTAELESISKELEAYDAANFPPSRDCLNLKQQLDEWDINRRPIEKRGQKIQAEIKKLRTQSPLNGLADFIDNPNA